MLASVLGSVLPAVAVIPSCEVLGATDEPSSFVSAGIVALATVDGATPVGLLPRNLHHQAPHQQWYQQQQ